MDSRPLVDANTSTRDLLRMMKTRVEGADDVLPESAVWQAYCELRRRGEPGADDTFVAALRRLHRRRTLGEVLPSEDPDPDEHKRVEDGFLGELWRAYKRALSTQRIAPAGILLRDIEAQVLGN